MRSSVVVLAAALLLGACQAMYEPPKASGGPVSRSIDADQGAIHEAAKQVLATNGYQVLGGDRASGTISTLPRKMALTALEGDCGTAGASVYIDDPWTVTTVAISVIAEPGRATAVATVEGESTELEPGFTSVVITCASTGALEEKVLDAIEQRL